MHITSPLSEDRAGALPAGGGARGGADGQDALEHEAATWAVRRHGGLDVEGYARLQAWLAADPAHAAALDTMAATLQGVRHLPAQDVARLRAALPDQMGRAAPQPSFWNARLRPFVPHTAAAMLALAVVGAGWFGWWLQPTFEQAYASQRGQQIVTTLPDDAAAGSTVQLDTATRIQARLYRNRREVVLSGGQAMFAVHSDPGRPFLVIAGDLRITVVGTRFSVRHTTDGVDAGRTVVAVEEGRVRVERQSASASGGARASVPQGAPAVVELTAGQMLEGPGQQDPDSGVGTVTSIAPAAVAQWRSGRISFDRTPLVQALAEFERYGPTGLVVRDPAVAALPVGGSYGLRQHQRFAEFLPQLLPVRLVQQGGVTEIVAR